MALEAEQHPEVSTWPRQTQGRGADGNVREVPESLEIGPWGWDFLGSSSQTLSALDGCEQKTSLSLNIHRSPIPIFNPLPSTGASLVCA